MAKSVQFTSRFSLILHRPKPISSLLRPPLCRKLHFLSLSTNTLPGPVILRAHFSTTATPYPLQYDMIISRPVQEPTRIRRPRLPPPQSHDPDADELGFDNWVDRKLSAADGIGAGMSKGERKYYNKRRKRMYGSDSEDENSKRDENDTVELKQEVVELRTLHKREEELYFHDAFAYPWEKDKHYKMVYQLEKKYFPDQCFDKAFLQPGRSNEGEKKGRKKKVEIRREDKKENVGENNKLVFFDDAEEKGSEREENDTSVVKVDISQKKVEEFFKNLKKVPNHDSNVASTEPFLSSRSSGLPPKWDSHGGTVVLINKPKGDLLCFIRRYLVSS